MKFALMSFYLLGLVMDAALSDKVSSIIPTKEEQSNLLRNVEEVFTTVQAIVTDEGGATDDAVIYDVERMAERALRHLALVEDSALMKLACKTSEKSLCRKDATRKIQKAIQEGEQRLHDCIEHTAGKMHNNSEVVTQTIRTAMDEGQVFLDTLNQCSRKMGLQLISCYKKIMANDVFPLKLILVNALNIHKSGHLEAITIRKGANDCIDDVLRSYHIKVTQILSEALATCS